MWLYLRTGYIRPFALYLHLLVLNHHEQTQNGHDQTTIWTDTRVTFVWSTGRKRPWDIQWSSDYWPWSLLSGRNAPTLWAAFLLLTSQQASVILNQKDEGGHRNWDEGLVGPFCCLFVLKIICSVAPAASALSGSSNSVFFLLFPEHNSVFNHVTLLTNSKPYEQMHFWRTPCV